MSATIAAAFLVFCGLVGVDLALRSCLKSLNRLSDEISEIRRVFVCSQVNLNASVLGNPDFPTHVRMHAED
jgi:hypothetical protein